MDKYILVEVCTSTERYIPVHTGMYMRAPCTYIPGHTSMSWYGEIGTGDSTYWYVLVHTSTYWYVLVCTVYNGIYYHVYLWVHAMKAPLGHLERVASGTYYTTKLF
jgi:hypothetical protein